MRIAFVSHSRRKVGGAEAYLGSVLPALAAARHEVAWLYEWDQPPDREPIGCPEDIPRWCGADLGLTDALSELRRWQPDIIYTHGLREVEFESALIDVAPSVLYIHNYYGTCISGDKLHSTAVPRVCERRFGPACLLHYFPERCGGRSPFTMWSQYRLQSRRQELMRRYRALIANSEYIVREMARHGLASECVYPFTATTAGTGAISASFADEPLRLIFAGRMSLLKGGQYLLEAAPIAQKLLGRRLHVTFAGDDANRAEWERCARRLATDNLAFDFPGWLAAPDLQKAIARSHLLVMPSIWPEPFGLSGPEAGLLGVPAVAFAVGGIPEWLNDGVSGHLASAPPTAEGLAQAIAKAFASAEHYQMLRAGACRESHRYSLDDHLGKLVRIFERCRA